MPEFQHEVGVEKLHTSKTGLVFVGEKGGGSESEFILWAVLKMLLPYL